MTPRELIHSVRRLPPLVWGLGLVSLLTDIAADMVYPLLPKLLERVGGGPLALGVMEGVAEATSALLKIGAGSVVDRGVRAGALVVGGYGLAALARPVLSVASAPWHVVVLRSIDRVGKGIRSAPRDALLASAVDKSQRALAFGVHRALDNLGAVFGAGIAFLLLGVAGLSVETVLLASVIPGLISTLVAAITVRREPAPPQPAVQEVARARGPFPRRVRAFLFALAVFSLALSADSFLLAHLANQGLAIQLLPIAWISLQLGKAMLNPLGGALADRFGARRAVLSSWLVYAVAYAAFAWSPSASITWLVFILYAAHYGLGEGAEKALLVELTPPEIRGRALGWLHALSGGALLGANLLFGILYLRAPALAFRVGAGIALGAALLLGVIGGSDEPHTSGGDGGPPSGNSKRF